MKGVGHFLTYKRALLFDGEGSNAASRMLVR